MEGITNTIRNGQFGFGKVTVVTGNTQPTTIGNNTIWIKTGVTVGHYYFASSDPRYNENLSNGDVWFMLGDCGNNSITFTEGRIQTTYYIMQVNQYIDGKWVGKFSKYYNNNAWTPWTHWLYYAGTAWSADNPTNAKAGFYNEVTIRTANSTSASTYVTRLNTYYQMRMRMGIQNQKVTLKTTNGCEMFVVGYIDASSFSKAVGNIVSEVSHTSGTVATHTKNYLSLFTAIPNGGSFNLPNYKSVIEAGTYSNYNVDLSTTSVSSGVYYAGLACVVGGGSTAYTTTTSSNLYAALTVNNFGFIGV